MTTNPKETLSATAGQSNVNLKALALQMDKLALLEAKVKDSAPDEDFRLQAKLTAQGIFRLIVMGEIKRGKSSLINALLGTENLVPVHSDVATSTVFKIHEGPALKYTVYFEKDSGKEKKAISPEQVNEYGTETGNPHNVKQVDFIRVESPAASLKGGLVIVDTPGVGGLFKKHREITFRHAPNADGVFFVVESDGAPIGEAEVKFIKELRETTRLITFTQTKSTKVDDEPRRKRMENNLKILREQVGIPENELSYFIIDSKLKMSADQDKDLENLEDSGFIPLMGYLNNTLRRNQETNVARAGLARTFSKLLPLKQEIADRLRLLDADSAEQRAEIDLELKKAQQQLQEWEATKKPEVLDRFKKGITALSYKAQDDLSVLQPGHGLCVESAEIIWAAENADAVCDLLTQVEGNLQAAASSVCIDIAEKAQEDVGALLVDLMGEVIPTSIVRSDQTELIAHQSATNQLQVNTSTIQKLTTRQIEGSFFEAARTGLYGGMAGAAIVSVVGGFVGSVIPIVGTIAGSWLGMTIAGLWGSHQAVTLNTKQKLEALKLQADSGLQQAFASAYQVAFVEIKRFLAKIQAEATKTIQKTLNEANANLALRRQEVARRAQESQKEISEKRKLFSALIAEAESIEKSLLAFRRTLSE
jgi:GTP-binding protein EngB required for normal cell division/outer membrane lipoprotein SlyB